MKKLVVLASIASFMLAACASHAEIPVPEIEPTTAILANTPVHQTQTATVVAPETLGTLRYFNYKYVLVHDYNYYSCTFNPYVCPEVYSALLSDVHNWIYVQNEKAALLEFNFPDNYQLELFEDNDCAVAQNTKNRHLVEVTCADVGEYTLQFGLVNEEQPETYLLVLKFISVPDLALPPAVIPLGLTVEEHELVQHPDTEPLSFKSVEENSGVVLAKHEGERGKSVTGAQTVLLENGQLIQAEENFPATASEPSQVLYITITQNENEIFEMQAPVSPISAFRGLWAIENDWFAEIAVTRNDSFRSFTKGDIFKDGISLNETHGYSESFGLQLLGGKPFYFFERFGRVGVSYDGQDIPLGYDHVSHHRCCSAGELNPRSFENMVGFFAVRGDKWYYVEIGAFK